MKIKYYFDIFLTENHYKQTDKYYLSGGIKCVSEIYPFKEDKDFLAQPLIIMFFCCYEKQHGIYSQEICYDTKSRWLWSVGRSPCTKWNGSWNLIVIDFEIGKGCDCGSWNLMVQKRRTRIIRAPADLLEWCVNSEGSLIILNEKKRKEKNPWP